MPDTEAATIGTEGANGLILDGSGVVEDDSFSLIFIVEVNNAETTGCPGF